MTMREAILAVCASLIKPTLRTGTATNIDLNNCKCDVQLDESGELFIYDVRLKSIQSDDKTGVVCVPKDGSVVTAARNEGVEADWVIVKCNEVDNWAVFTSGGKLQVNKDGSVWLNGKQVAGQDSPLAEINKLVQRRNNIENKLSTHQHGYVTPGGPAVTTADPSGSQVLTPVTMVSDISNTKVYQGDGN